LGFCPACRRFSPYHFIRRSQVENVAEANSHCEAYAVDVASGVESKPGKKDHVRLKELLMKFAAPNSNRDAAGESISL